MIPLKGKPKMPLILPAHLTHLHRPLKAAATEDLLLELHHRNLLHELTGHIAMPDPIQFGEAGPTAEQWQQLRQTQALEMAKQMGAAVFAQQFVLLQSAMQQDPTSRTGVKEVIVAKMLVCRHYELVGVHVALDRPAPPPVEDGKPS